MIPSPSESQEMADEIASYLVQFIEYVKSFFLTLNN